MTHLNLTGSSVVGNFPSEIFHLSKLVSLDLSFNFGMRIETPSLKRLVQNLTHLSELVLDYVNMSSISPNSFMNLSSSLTSLRLSGCELKRRFPDNIFHLPNLQLQFTSRKTKRCQRGRRRDVKEEDKFMKELGETKDMLT